MKATKRPRKPIRMDLDEKTGKLIKLPWCLRLRRDHKFAVEQWGNLAVVALFYVPFVIFLTFTEPLNAR